MYKLINLFFCTALLFSCRNASIDTQRKNDTMILSEDILLLEEEYQNTLEPVQHLKTGNPDIYWFIVSWMGTNYGRPNWKGYASNDWQAQTKQKGIDCSGFVRVMMDQLFGKSVKGSSQTLFHSHCIRVSKDDLKLGDIVFFYPSKNNRGTITHAGVYLDNGYFVHATSPRTAKKGLGINISSLNKKHWRNTWATAGRPR